MYPCSHRTFVDVASSFRSVLKEHAPPVKTERWQGVAANTDTFEIRNACFEVPLRGIEDLSFWRGEIQPNLPWADDHFLERVGGKALNPGEEWKRWPYSQSANKFRSPDEVGPRMAPQDWAYLAGMIDGEGTIYYQSKKLPAFQGVLRVYQKERKVLDYLRDLFRVGDVHQIVNSEQELNGVKYQNIGHQWGVGAIAEIRWLLHGCLPYLIVKKDKAVAMLSVIEEALKIEKRSGLQTKKVWGQDWPGRFQANYMDHFWPRRLEGSSDFYGIQGRYGDLNDLVNLLAKEPHTRQAWFPVFHPDETGGITGGRVMCTLGYQVMVRDGEAHMFYPLRSCDFVRHFRDDCYLAVRLLLWIIDRCREVNPEKWNAIKPGSYAMWMTSLHVFASDREKL